MKAVSILVHVYKVFVALYYMCDDMLINYRLKMVIIKTHLCLQMYCCLWKDTSGCSEYTYFTTVSPVRPCFAKPVSKWKC